MSRYARLLESVAYFAASPESQLASDWGADGAVNDTPWPLEKMFDLGEVTHAEIDIIRPLEALIEQSCATAGLKPWHDERALFSDALWGQIRLCAINVLEQLSDAKREGGQLIVR